MILVVPGWLHHILVLSLTTFKLLEFSALVAAKCLDIRSLLRLEYQLTDPKT